MADLRPRSDFRRSLVDPVEDRPGRLSLHRLLEAGTIDVDPIVDIPYMHLVSIDLSNEERTQYHQNPYDGGKVNLFGRMPKIHSLTWALLDSDLSHQAHGSPPNERDPVYHGHTLQDWMRKYEESFRLSVCLKNRHVVRVVWRSSTIFGYIISQVRSHESKDPNLYSVGMTFLSILEVEDVPVVPTYDVTYDVHQHPSGDRPPLSGAVFRETLGRYGLLPPVSGVAAVAQAIGESWVDQTANLIAQRKAEKNQLIIRG